MKIIQQHRTQPSGKKKEKREKKGRQQLKPFTCK
jgi:hypothetical protein